MAKKENAAVPVLILIVVLSVYGITLITEESSESTGTSERVIGVTEWPTLVHSIDTTISITREEATWETEELIRMAKEESGVRYIYAGIRRQISI